MGSEWRTYRIDDLCDFTNGFAFKSTDYVSQSDDTLEVFRMGYIERGGGFKEDSTPVFVHKNYGKSLEKFLLAPGDIMIAMTDMKDRVAILANTAWIRDSDRFVGNQRVGRLRVKRRDLLDPRFLYFYSNWPPFVDHLRSRANSGVQVNLSTAAIKEATLEIPSLSEQQAIAEILGTLDDKIELNRQMNTTLEATAKALFQSWFVDFDPVRAKMDGRQPVGMDAETAALFPNKFQDSELERIPEGWETRPLSEIVDVVKGRSYRSDELAESKTALVTLKSFLRGGGYRTDGLKPFTGEYKLNQRVRPGDLVVAFTDVTQAADVIGKPALIRSDDRFETLVASLDVGIVRPKTKHTSIAYLYCLFLTNEFQTHTYSHATGTTVLHLSAAAIPSFVCVIPPVEITERFAERAEPIFLLIDENAKQSRTLAILRDTLLPKLLSGTIRINVLENTL